MAKSSAERRLANRIRHLRLLRETEPLTFQNSWKRLECGWLGEVKSRAKSARRLAAGAEERRLHLFGVLHLAQSVARMIGAINDKQIIKSLGVIAHECAKEVALLTDHRLYAFNKDCTARLAESHGKAR